MDGMSDELSWTLIDGAMGAAFGVVLLWARKRKRAGGLRENDGMGEGSDDRGGARFWITAVLMTPVVLLFVTLVVLLAAEYMEAMLSGTHRVADAGKAVHLHQILDRIMRTIP
jgi:hypothetical protein